MNDGNDPKTAGIIAMLNLSQALCDVRDVPDTYSADLVARLAAPEYLAGSIRPTIEKLTRWAEAIETLQNVHRSAARPIGIDPERWPHG